MFSHFNHHFVPRFLLQEWHTEPDDKLSCFRWESGRFLHNRYSAKSVAKMKGLYSTGVSSYDDGNILEREYFAVKVDSPAAVVHKLILAHGISCLDDEHRRSWARFLLAQVVRTPDKVAHVRSIGSQLMDDLAVPNVLDKFGIPQSHKSAMHRFLVNNAPDFAGNYSLAHMPSAIEVQLENGRLLSAYWLLRRIKKVPCHC